MIAAAGAFDLLVRSSLLLATAWAAAAVVRVAGGSAAMRHMVWLLGLAALIMLPFLAALLPPLPLPIVPDVLADRAATAPPLNMAASAAGTAVAAERERGLGADELLQIFYLAIALALLGRLALSRFLLARLWRQAIPGHDAEWAGLLERSATALGIGRRLALRFTADPAMPMTWGTLRPRIVLPEEARCWSGERRGMVLSHELAHVARGDSFSRAAAALVCALYWPHPGIWYAARRMRLEQEHACDDLVLALGAERSAYARDLLEIASTLRPAGAVGGLSVAMARSSQLEQRLKAIVREAPRRRSSAPFMAGSGAAALLATFLIATAAPVTAQRPAPAADPDPARRQRAVAKPLASEVPVRPPAAVFSGTAIRATIARAETPAVPAVPRLPVPAPLPARPPEPKPMPDYDTARRQYERELEIYYRDLARYDAELEVYHWQVEELRSQGNLANSGNSGNTGNSGNYGQPGRPARGAQPAIPAVMPVSPISPTSPTPPSPRHRHPRTAASQGP